jgi:uncharacterized protein YbjT (DUF2867 family)
MGQQSVFLVFGATGQTGRHFVALALKNGHKVRALVRNPGKLLNKSSDLEVHQGSIDEVSNLDELLHGVDYVVSMLGDMKLQKEKKMVM